MGGIEQTRENMAAQFDGDAVNTYIATKVCPKRYVGNLDPKRIVFSEKKEDDANTDAADGGNSSSSLDKRAMLPAKKSQGESKGANKKKKFYTATYPGQQDAVLAVTSPCTAASFCNLHHGNWAKNPDIKAGNPAWNKINPLDAYFAATVTSEDYSTGFVSLSSNRIFFEK